MSGLGFGHRGMMVPNESGGECIPFVLTVYFDGVLVATDNSVPCEGDTTVVIDLLNP